MIATVTAQSGGVSPVGTVAFTNNGAPISGCGSIPVSGTGSSLTVTCTTSFAAAQSSAALAATYTPSTGTFVLPSVSATDTFAIGRDPTSAAVLSAGMTNYVDTPVTYTALVTPSQFGPARPSGWVWFMDNGVAIPGCTAQPLSGFGTASCTHTYPTPGAHAITAGYSGDVNFVPTSSPAAAVAIQPLGRINATMLWTFAMAKGGTRVVGLDVLNVGLGSSVAVGCRGAGCSFRRGTVSIRKSCRGVKHKRSCLVAGHPLHLAGWFGRRRLRPGAVITVQITRTGWVGKVYQFDIRRGQAPRVPISCLPPGASRPTSC
jgi:hypothetical protein